MIQLQNEPDEDSRDPLSLAWHWKLAKMQASHPFEEKDKLAFYSGARAAFSVLTLADDPGELTIEELDRRLTKLRTETTFLVG